MLKTKIIHYYCVRLCKTFAKDSAAIKSKWNSVVGLEIHAQIDTKSKLFSGAGIDFNASVNSRVSLFDAAVPGTLPVLNKRCVELAVKTALALSCNINPVSMFDRKHYFYSDSPAGYQITQQRAPLANNGELIFPVFVPGVTKKPYHKRVRIHQLQLEQDSGKSLHDVEEKKSLVDLNRAGIPLMEVVFEPDLNDGEEAAALVKELILILKRLKTCSCKMEEGALRIDANVSIHQKDQPFGIRTEIKNIGSVRGVAQAIAYEIRRQINLVNSGGIVHNETRGWDAMSKRTVPMRDKEVQQDYRFMPEPNLPMLHLQLGSINENFPDLINVDNIKNTLPELPEITRQNLITNYGLSEEVAVILVREDILLQYFLGIINGNSDILPKTITNLLINDLLTLCNKYKIDINDCKIQLNQMIELIEMMQHKIINLKIARLILQKILFDPKISPKEISIQNQWLQISDQNKINKLCIDALERNPNIVKLYREGKHKVLFALAGEISKLTEEKANMEMVVETLNKMLKNQK